MNSSSFLGADGTLEPAKRSRFAEWLPSLQQMSNAVQLQFAAPARSMDLSAPDPNSVFATSMRQGLGMIIVLALIAGSLLFVINWIGAAHMGTAVPLAEFAHRAMQREGAVPAGLANPMTVLFEAGQTIAGLHPAVFPGWLAAGLSALGVWVNTPLRWLTMWLVYGLGVLIVAKLLGATTTLQRFYALTSYAAIPLVLTILGPIPCLGFIAGLIAYLWAFAIYLVAVREVTGTSLGYAFLCILAPGAIAVMAVALVSLSLIVTLVRMFI